jgi:fatty-acyl-CoA synthase
VPDERFGEEIMAWVIAREGATVDEDELREYCRGKIARYKIPRYVASCSEFPMTVTGKIQKHELRARAIEKLGLHAEAGLPT